MQILLIYTIIINKLLVKKSKQFGVGSSMHFFFDIPMLMEKNSTLLLLLLLYITYSTFSTRIFLIKECHHKNMIINIV